MTSRILARNIITLATFFSFGLGSLPSLAASPDAREEQVQFETGSTGTHVESSIVGSQSVNYTLRAGAGQMMDISISSDNNGNYFNLYAPGYGPGDEAIFAGARDGGKFSAALPTDGEYTVQVYLIRSAARRNETANFALDINISGTAVTASTATQPDDDDVKWPQDTDASGNIPCGSSMEDLTQSCAFKVKRNSFGATIWVLKPGLENELRTLYFESDAFTSDDDATLSWNRVSDSWIVNVGDKAFYHVPDALIFGG